MRRVFLLILCLACAIPGTASTASAYTYETGISSGCHERITTDALILSRLESDLSAGPSPRSLRDDMPFDVNPAVRDSVGLTLLLAVRDNDLKGLGPDDLGRLAEVHGNSATQAEHCLRSPGDDGPAGAESALAACRTYIMRELDVALNATDAEGRPDVLRLEPLAVTLALRGSTTLQVSSFYLHMGRALHALQDSYTHTFRNDAGEIVTVTTWVDALRDDYDETRDGPRHADALDRCEKGGELRALRQRSARDASRDLLVLATARAPVDVRRSALASRVAALIALAPGAALCTASNHYCDSPDSAVANERRGCSLAPHDSPTFGGSAAVLCGIMMWLTVRRTRRTSSRRTVRQAAMLAAWLYSTLVQSSQAAAQARAPSAREFPAAKRFALVLATGASFDRGGVAQSAGMRYRMSDNWDVSLQAERNSWFSLTPARARVGAFNAYASLTKRWSVHSPTYAIRTTVHLGTSRLLFELSGVPKGSTGLFFGTSLLGLESALSKSVVLVVEPANVVVAAPLLSGVPFVYVQYRFTVGFEFGVF